MAGKTRQQKNLIPKAKLIIEIMQNGFKQFNVVSIFYSQEYWLKQLKRFGGRDIKRRQLNYDFKLLEQAGILKRYRRHKPDPEKGYILRSTRYYIDATGWKIAAYYKIIHWTEMCKMINAIKKGAQNKTNRVKKWITPDWIQEYMPEFNRKSPIPDG